MLIVVLHFSALTSPEATFQVRSPSPSVVQGPNESRPGLVVCPRNMVMNQQPELLEACCFSWQTATAGST